jgi:EAL domain-containing protein (putative c-di-GMP-specific phosphodiesterase class I)
MVDFGTGYSSLGYLRSFPFDKIKIDRSFIKDLPHDENSRAIVKAIVGLSNTFGMEVTAEGVETIEQAEQLSGENCTQLQGYLFGKPLSAEMTQAFIAHIDTGEMKQSHLMQLRIQMGGDRSGGGRETALG